jgi:hypothetical protein
MVQVSGIKVVVRAPDDLACLATAAPGGKGRTLGVPFEIDEGAIAAFPTHAI